MKALGASLCACLFVVACKEEAKPAPAAQKLEEPTKVERSRPRPSLPPTSDTPDSERVRPRLPDGAREPRDGSDPEEREEMRVRMEERRKQREAMLDLNKDGVVSPDERVQRLKPMVERFDQNDDGKLTVDELATSDRRMGFDDPAALDTDQNGEISLGELDAAVTARREQMRARWRGRGGVGSAQGVGPD